MNSTGGPHFARPGPLERRFNWLYGALTARGWTFKHNYILETQGRRTGRSCRTPVNLLTVRTSHFLVAPRGTTNWVRNLETAGGGRLLRGAVVMNVTATRLDAASAVPVLREYLGRFQTSVQRYFALTPDAPDAAFANAAADHPCFRLQIR